MRFPVVKGPLGCKRLRQGDVLPDIAEVSEVRVRHARTSLRSRYGFPPLPGNSAFACASVRECPPSEPLQDRFRRSGWWCGCQAMPAHDFAEQSDVRWAIASKNAGDIPEVARAEQTRTDDRKEASVSIAIISESVDHPPRYEECLARIQIGARSPEGKRRDAVQPEDGFIELVVAVR